MNSPPVAPSGRARELFAQYQFQRTAGPKSKDTPDGFEPKEFAKLVIEVEKLHLEREKFAHTRWWQEDALVNQRLTWLLLSQGVMFAAFGVAKRPAPEQPSGSDPTGASRAATAETTRASTTDGASAHQAMADLADLLPVLGCFICLSILIGVIAAGLAQRRLRKDYASLHIKLGVSRGTICAGHTTGWLLPLGFIAAWLWLGYARIQEALRRALELAEAWISVDHVIGAGLLLAAAIPTLIASRRLARSGGEGPPTHPPRNDQRAESDAAEASRDGPASNAPTSGPAREERPVTGAAS